MSGKDEAQDERIAAMERWMEAHEARCERRQDAIWGKLERHDKMLLAILIGTAIVFGAEVELISLVQAALG